MNAPFHEDRPRGWKKLRRSILKTLLTVPMYVEHHGGWRQGSRHFPRSLKSAWQTGGFSEIAKQTSYYRTLAGATIDSPPPWEVKRELPLDHSNSCFLSIIIPVTASTSHLVAECLNSVMAQSSIQWELFLVVSPTDQRSIPWKRNSLRGSCGTVHVVEDENLASGFNSAVNRSRSEWITILEPHARLRTHALEEISAQLANAPEVDWIYPDAVLAGEVSRFRKGLLRPDFSAEFLLSQHFTEGLNLVRKELLNMLAETDDDAGEAFTYDLLLRLSEVTSSNRISHDTSVLIELNKAALVNTQIQLQATRRALTRRNLIAEVTEHPDRPHVRNISVTPRELPSVTIFISTRNSAQLVKACVQSIRDKTNYPNYDIVVIDNQSDEPELLEFLQHESASDRFSTFRYDHPFNHSEMHNQAVAEFPSDLVVFMNNDTEIITDQWLEQLVAGLELSPEISGIGPMLLYPDGTIQHAGIVLGVHYGAGHYFRGMSPSDLSYLDRSISLQQVSACTAALLLLKRDAFLEVGGFDAERYPASFNDVDLWIRLQNAGHRCLYQPAVQALHFESKTRPIVSSAERDAIKRLRSDWPIQLQSDPFHHPAMSIENELLLGFRPNFSANKALDDRPEEFRLPRAA